MGAGLGCPGQHPVKDIAVQQDALARENWKPEDDEDCNRSEPDSGAATYRWQAAQSIRQH